MEDEDVYVLRGIGVNNDDLSVYKELHMKMIRAFTVIMITGLVVTPSLLVPAYYQINHEESLFLYALYILLIPIVLGGGYFQFVLLKVNRRYAKLIEKTWSIWVGGDIFKEKKLLILMNIGIAEGMCLMLAFWVFTGNILSIVFAVLLLILIPSINLAAREKIGFSIEHLFNGDVELIADKLSIALNGKKKMLIKSKNNRRYEIEFENPYKFRVFVYRRPDRKGFTEVSIWGVKPENVSEATRLVSQIEKALQ